jgi:hypothetical protein
LPAGLLVLFFLLFMAADAWLESPSGKRTLERAVSRALEMPVELRGEFSIKLSPPLGVSGTELFIGGRERGATFVFSSEYELSLALMPLLDGVVRVLSARFAEGVLNATQYPVQRSEGSPAATSRLPEIQHLELADFRVVFPGSEDTQLLVRNLVLDGFRENLETPVSMDVGLVSDQEMLLSVQAEANIMAKSGGMVLSLDIRRAGMNFKGTKFSDLAGRMEWNRKSGQLTAGLQGQGEENETFAADIQLSAASGSGLLKVNYAGLPALAGNAVLDFNLVERGVRLTAVDINAMNQRLNGSGCLLTGETPSLELLLHAQSLDLRQFPADFGAGADRGSNAPIELNVQLTAAEVRAGKLIIRDLGIQAGRKPDCSSLLD